VVSAQIRNHPVLCKNSADRLSRPPLVVVEYPAQAFMAHNGRIHLDYTLRLLDQPIVEPLMIPLNVIMLHEFLHGAA